MYTASHTDEPQCSAVQVEACMHTFPLSMPFMSSRNCNRPSRRARMMKFIRQHNFSRPAQILSSSFLFPTPFYGLPALIHDTTRTASLSTVKSFPGVAAY